MNPACGRCERGAPFDGPYDVTRQCRACWLIHNDSAYQKLWRRGLGDWLAWLLSSVGITKARVEKVTGKPCGCDKRQQKLNELGEKLGL